MKNASKIRNLTCLRWRFCDNIVFMKNKVIIVTGASGEIGSEITKVFANRGYCVVACYNKSKDQIDKLLASLKGKNVLPFKADLRSEKDIKALVEFTLKTFNNIDVLINCAGAPLNKMVLDTSEAEVEDIFKTNVFGPIMLSKAVLPHMIEKRDGVIINISSVLSKGASCEAVYSATKGALEAFTKSLALEYGSANIRVNAVSPGFIDTKMNSNLTQEEIEDIKKSTTLGRLGSPKDIAPICLFLASEEAEFIIGQIIGVDGGGF